MDFDGFAARELDGLLRYATVLTGERELARDLVQDVLLKAYRRWSHIATTEFPRAYVRTMVTRAYLSWRRSWATRNVLLTFDGSDDQFDGPAAGDHAHAIAERDAVWQRLATLPRRQRSVLVLRYYERLADAEIAEVLGCSAVTVRGYASRALATLRLDAAAPRDLAAASNLRENPMTTDQLLIDLFAERAEQRPEASDVLASVRRRIDAPCRVTATGVATVFGSAAAVAALAVGLSVATSHGHGAPHPRLQGAAAPGVFDGASVAPSGTTTVPAAPSASTAQSTPTAAITSGAAPTLVEAPGLGRVAGSRDYSTIAAGWLPGPVTHVEASNQPGFEQRDYTVVVDGVEMDAIIYLEDGPLPGSTEAGSDYRSLTINGHPAREFVAGTATIVAVDLGNGKIAYAGPSVVATTNQVTTARITQIAEHIASSIQFNRHDHIG